MKGTLLVALLLISSVAAAENIRITIRPATGELAAWPSNACGKEVADNVWRIVFKRPYVEMVDGIMSARIDEQKPVRAHRQVLSDTYTAFFDPSDLRTIAFTIRYKDAKDRKVPVEVSIIVRDPVDRTKACRETWIGSGEKI